MDTKGNGHVQMLGFDHPDLAQEYDLTEVRQRARAEGLDLSLPSVQTAIAKRRQTAIEAAPPAPPAPPRIYVLMQNFMIGVGHILTSLVMLVISHVVLPLSIVGLAIAEYARVKAGIATFDPARSNLLSGVAVIFYLGLLVVYSNKIDGQEIRRDKFSLRLVYRQLRYFVGIGHFKTQQITSINLLEQALKWDGMLIILLGTVGSLQDKLAIEGAWHSALVKLLTESDLPTFLSLVGGLLLTAGLLFSLRFLVDYLWQSFRQLLPEGSTNFFDLSSEDSRAADQAEIEYLLNRIRQKEHQT